MSNYTPTTEVVRYNFATMEDEEATKDNEAAFDRWLAEVKAEERERIIKLLEDTPATRTTWIDDGISVYALDKDDFIALIKGAEQ